MRDLNLRWVIAVFTLVAVGQAWAGVVEPIADDGGVPEHTQCEHDDQECTENRGSGAATVGKPCNCADPVNNPPYDPDANVELAPAGDFNDWVACEAACFNDSPEYEATPDSSDYGLGQSLEVWQDSGEELDAICGWDDMEGIQGWHLSLAASDRIAKFNRPEAPGWNATPGEIHFEINGVPVVVTWTNGMSAQSLDDKVIKALRDHDFEVETSDGFIRIVSDMNVQGSPGIHDFTIRYGPGTNLNVIYVGLEPMNDWDSLLCLDPSWPLGQLLAY